MKQFYIIKEEQEKYKVFSLFDEFSPVYYNSEQDAVELCRMRLNKTLIENNMKMYKIPFTKITILW